MEQLTLDGRDPRVKVYINRSCLCDRSLGSRCWAAKCIACGVPLTKHSLSEQDAHDEAVHALDVPGHFQHRCKAERLQDGGLQLSQLPDDLFGVAS